jgi:PEGA domain
MLASVRFYISLLSVLFLTSVAGAQTKPKPNRPGHKMRVKIDSAPQQAAVYVDSKDYGIEGYTPVTIKLPKGTYTIILELPGFQTVQKPIVVEKSQAFVFTMERQARPAVLDVRAPASNDGALGGQLFVDGAPVGTVPGRVEVAAGHHLIEVKKPGFKDWRDSADVNEGDQRTMVVDMQAEIKKGSILVTTDVAGADVFVDGVRKDAAPALISDLPEGPHVVEVRKDGAPPWKQSVNVVAGQQTKVNAAMAAAMVGSLRVVSSTSGAEVIVDGEPKGPANAEITGLRPGQHIVEVRAKGFQSQAVEVQVAAGEQRIAKIDLQPGAAATAHLRVVTPIPDAEVFVDGASMGKAPLDRSDLAPGKHFVVVRKQGYAEWKREVDLDTTSAVTLSAELSASGTLKVLSNVGGANVFLDGSPVGKTPLTLDSVAAGDHLLEVKAEGYIDAKQSVHIDGGEQKILAADLAKVRTGPSAADVQRRMRGSTSFGAVAIDPAKFTVDVGAGFVPFGLVRLTVGALRWKFIGFDTGIDLRTTGYFTEGGVHGRLQFLQAGPFAMGATLFIGGGGGPTHRNNFVFEFGVPMTLLFGDIVRFTVHPYVQVYSDRNCASVDDARVELAAKTLEEVQWCKAKDQTRGGMGNIPDNGQNPISMQEAGRALASINQDPRDRFTSARLMLRGVLEVAIVENVNIFAIFEGDPIGTRWSLSQQFSSLFPGTDHQVYGALGATFKF